MHTMLAGSQKQHHQQLSWKQQGMQQGMHLARRVANLKQPLPGCGHLELDLQHATARRLGRLALCFSILKQIYPERCTRQRQHMLIRVLNNCT